MPDPHRAALPSAVPLTVAGLAEVAASLAAQAPLWLAVAGDHPSGPRTVPDPDADDEPWGTRIASGPGWEAWLHSWEHGQVGELHAHDGHGAIAVLSGSLLEDVPAGASGVLEPGRVHGFPAGHRHGLAALAGPAVSVHVVARAFSPAQPVRRRSPAPARAARTDRQRHTPAALASSVTATTPRRSR